MYIILILLEMLAGYRPHKSHTCAVQEPKWRDLWRLLQFPKGWKRNPRTGREGGRHYCEVEVNRRTMIAGERLISQGGGVEEKLKALQQKIW